MKLLMALAAGYVLGASTGGDDFRDVTQSLRAIRESDEVRDLLSSLRSHAGHTLRELATLMERAAGEVETVDAAPSADLVERVRHLAGLR